MTSDYIPPSTIFVGHVHVFRRAARTSLLTLFAVGYSFFGLAGCAVFQVPSETSEFYSSDSRNRVDQVRSERTTNGDETIEYSSRDLPNVRASLIEETNSWMGTPYSFGGSTRSGIDCSAFVQVLYQDALGLQLPRSTTSQRTVGEPVRRSQLDVGDLVFFETGPKQKHVGVYLGGDEFSHASSSAGVTVSSLSDSYWSARFEEGIRPKAIRQPIQEVTDYKPVPVKTVSHDRVSLPDLRRGW